MEETLLAGTGTRAAPCPPHSPRLAAAAPLLLAAWRGSASPLWRCLPAMPWLRSSPGGVRGEVRLLSGVVVAICTRQQRQ